MTDFTDEQDDNIALAQSFLRPEGYGLPAEKTGHEQKQDKLSDMFEPPNPDDADMYAVDVVAAPDISPTDDLVTMRKSDVTGYERDEEPDDMHDLFEPPDPNDADMKVDDILQVPDQEGVDDLVNLEWDTVSGYPVQEATPSEPEAPDEEVTAGEHWSDADLERAQQVVPARLPAVQRRIAPRRRVAKTPQLSTVED